MVLWCAPIEVMTEPSCSTATPSASIGPDVIGSGRPSGKRWRHRRLIPSTEAVKYICDPSGAQLAEVQAPRGPIDLALDRPSRKIRRQGPQFPFSSISTTKADL